jgi:hypothetical protein
VDEAEDDEPFRDERPIEATVYTIRRAHDADAPSGPGPALGDTLREERAVRGVTRWNAQDPQARPRDRLVEGRADGPAAPPSIMKAAEALADAGRDAKVLEFPVSASVERAAYVAGTFDTKGRELFFLRNCLEKLGVRTVTVDLSTGATPSPAMVHPREVARHHPTTAARRSPRWRSRSSTSCAGAATWAASCRPAARAVPRSPPPRCARCRSACRR